MNFTNINTVLFLRVQTWPSRSRPRTWSARPCSLRTVWGIFSTWPLWPASTRATRMWNARNPPRPQRGSPTCPPSLTWLLCHQIYAKTKPEAVLWCEEMDLMVFIWSRTTGQRRTVFEGSWDTVPVVSEYLLGGVLHLNTCASHPGYWLLTGHQNYSQDLKKQQSKDALDVSVLVRRLDIASGCSLLVSHHITKGVTNHHCVWGLILRMVQLFILKN